MRKWQRIPDDVKPILVKAAREAGERIRNETRQLSDDAVEVMKKHGLVVHHVPPDIVLQWERSARAGYPKIVGKEVPKQVTEGFEHGGESHYLREADGGRFDGGGPPLDGGLASP
jgi:TRAP-type C4-dicarboxylate transport system substrate-binding protein